MKSTLNVLSALFLVTAVFGGAAQAQDAGKLESEQDRFSYGLGMLVGERILKQYGEVNYELLLEGMKAQHQGLPTLLSVQEAGAAINAQQAMIAKERNAASIKQGEDYLASNAAKEGVTVTESGLQYSVITAADGAKPKPTDTVQVHYRGTLIDGTEFDSSYKRNSPATFGLSQVIPGWTEGVQLMSVGSKYRFVIPYQIGYGERGSGGGHTQGINLMAGVELLAINP